MKLLRSRISTTHVDLHGDRMTLQALQGAAQQLSQDYLSVMWNHDIRHPPLGRTVAAEVVPLENGEFALEATAECWEDGDTLESLRGDGRRRLRVRDDEYETFAVRYDRTFCDEEGHAFVHELAALAGVQPQPEEKKALEPVSTLIIAAGAFTVGCVASGFFGKLGADLYDALKSKLRSFFHRNPERRCLLDFQFVTELDERRFEVHVLVDDVAPQKIERLFDQRFDQVDRIVQAVCRTVPDVAWVVLEWIDDEMRLRYVVRDDGVPLMGELKTRQEPPKWGSLGGDIAP